jgi:hypothetical protein
MASLKARKINIDDIQAKIENEGFDYYFTEYGADEKLRATIGDQIDLYLNAREALVNAVKALGIELPE